MVLKTLLLLLLGIAGAAQADASADVLAEIARCSGITQSSERLACFDRVAGRAKQAAAPRPEDFGKPAPRPAEITELNATVRELAKTARGRAVFVLDNGQTWRQLDADSTEVLEPLRGQAMKVTIARGLFDSYNLTVEGRNGLIRVRRVQ